MLRNHLTENANTFAFEVERSKGGMVVVFVSRLALVLSCLLCGCPSKPSGSQPNPDAKTSVVPHEQNAAIQGGKRDLKETDLFDDVTESSGVDFVYRNGIEGQQFTILETVGGGVGLVDYDLDGVLDLCCAGGGTIDATTAQPDGLPCGLYQQQRGHFIDSSAAAGFDIEMDYSHACLAGDIDNDGFPDVLVTCYGSLKMFHNLGDGTFEEISSTAGLELDSWNTAAAFGDVNGDGLLDLYVTGYVDWKPDPKEVCARSNAQGQDVCPPQRYAPSADHVFFNTGQGGFEDVSAQIGIREDGKGLGVVAGDLDLDHHIDFYVANDVVANHLYTDWDGQQYAERGEIAGVGLNAVGSAEGSMGIAIGDIDGDLRQDLCVTNFELEDNSLYRNLSAGAFLHSTSAFGLGAQGRQLVGFGTGLCDFNSDSWPDIYFLNGHVLYNAGFSEFLQPSLLYLNQNGKRFVDVTEDAGPWFSISHAARGGAVGDLNDDGAPDLVISALNEPVSILKNQQPAKNWIRVKAVGTTSSRTPVGTSVQLKSFGRSCSQMLTSGAGYFSHSDERLLFALEEDQTHVTLEVDWISGRHEFFRQLKVQMDHVIIEGYGTQEKETQKSPDTLAR